MSNLQNNTTGLQVILAAVNELPAQGTGGGSVGPKGEDGYSIYSASYAGNNSADWDKTFTLSYVETNGRTIQIGDFILASDGKLYVVDFIESINAECYFVMSLVGPAGAAGFDGNDGSAIYYYSGNMGAAPTAGDTTEDGGDGTYPTTALVNAADVDLKPDDLIVDMVGNLMVVTVVYGSASFDAEYLTNISGPQGPAGPTGPAYTLTEADKADIAASVKASLTAETWTFELEDGTTATKQVVLK